MSDSIVLIKQICIINGHTLTHPLVFDHIGLHLDKKRK